MFTVGGGCAKLTLAKRLSIRVLITRVWEPFLYAFLAFPLSKELYAHITGAVIDEYNAQVEKQAQEQNQAQEASQEATQTEAASEAKPAPKRGKGR